MTHMHKDAHSSLSVTGCNQQKSDFERIIEEDRKTLWMSWNESFFSPFAEVIWQK